MYVKKVKRKCEVRGCKNTDCYSISRSREMGFSIIACESCLNEALEAIKEMREGPGNETEKEAKVKTEAKTSENTKGVKKK